MEIIPVHETKRMLKRPGSTVEIAVLRTEPRNGNLHPRQVSEKPHACEGHGLRFHLPRRFCPEPAGELLLVPRCLHQGRPAELHVCQQLLTSLSTSPQTPKGPSPPFLSSLYPRAWAQTPIYVLRKFLTDLQAWT